MALKVRDHDRPRTNRNDDERASFQQRAIRLDLSSVPKRKRKESLTSQLIDIYCRVLNESTQETAANAIGYSVRTISDWIAKGQDPECEDEVLMELAEKHAYVMACGNRKTTMDILREHAVDDPKTAVELAKMTIPSVNVAKAQKIDITNHVAKAPSAAEFAECSDREIELMAELERERLRRLAGG